MILTQTDQARVLDLLGTIRPPRGGAGKVTVTLTLNFAPGGALHRLQYGIAEESDVPALAKSGSVR